MRPQQPEANECCENCEHAAWLSVKSPYHGMGECYQHFNSENSTGEAVLLVSKDFGESCTYFEASEEATDTAYIEKHGRAKFLGVDVRHDCPATLART